MKNARSTLKAKAQTRALAARPARCRAKTREGKPCPANPVHGKRFCYWHIPGNASAKGSIGGRRRAIFRPEGLEPLPVPQNITDFLRLLAQTLSEVRAAKIDVRTATAIIYGCGVGRSLIEVSDLDARLKALEERRDSVEAARARLQ